MSTSSIFPSVRDCIGLFYAYSQHLFLLVKSIELIQVDSCSSIVIGTTLPNLPLKLTFNWTGSKYVASLSLLSKTDQRFQTHWNESFAIISAEFRLNWMDQIQLQSNLLMLQATKTFKIEFSLAD